MYKPMQRFIGLALLSQEVIELASGNDTIQTKNQRQSSLAVLLALSSVPLIMVLGNSMLIPVLPEIKSTLDLSQFQVSLLIALFSVSAGVIIPLSGILSDRLGRKKIIVPSLLLYGVGGLIAGGAVVIMDDPYVVILAGRILQGIGAAGTAPIAMALVSDIFTNQSRSKALGVIEAANAMGKVLSPILGSLIALITWYSLFFAFPLLTAGAALAVALLVKEPHESKKDMSLTEYKQSLVHTFKKQGRWLSVAFLAGAITLFVLFGVLFYLSDTLEKTYNIDGIPKGLVLAIPLLALSTTSYITGRIIKKNQVLMKWLIVWGLVLVGGISAFVPFVENNVLLISLLSVGGVGSGLVLPCLNMLITSAVAIDERGMVTSLYGSVRFLGVAGGPPLFGILMEDTKNVLFWSVSGATLLVALLFFLLVRPPQGASGGESSSKTEKTKTIFKKHSAKSPTR